MAQVLYRSPALDAYGTLPDNHVEVECSGVNMKRTRPLLSASHCGVEGLNPVQPLTISVSPRTQLRRHHRHL